MGAESQADVSAAVVVQMWLSPARPMSARRKALATSLGHFKHTAQLFCPTAEELDDVDKQEVGGVVTCTPSMFMAACSTSFLSELPNWAPSGLPDETAGHATSAQTGYKVTP